MFKRIILPIFVALVVLGVMGVIMFRHALAQIATDEPTLDAKKLEKTFISTSIDEGKPFTILLLGTSGGEHEGAYLADSLIVARIDPTKKDVALISVPRDLLIYPGAAYNIGSDWKVNAYYAIGLNDKDFPAKDSKFTGKNGGGRLTSAILGDLLGIPIDRYIAIDFDGFEHVIDAMGGVTVQVETSFTDREYPRAGHENDLCGHTEAELPALVAQLSYKAPYDVFPCRYQTVSFKKGSMKLTGAQALAFARSRHAAEDGSDFARSERQKLLIAGLKDAVISPAVIPHIPAIFKEAIKTIRTDMSTDELQALLLAEPKLATYKTRSIQLTNENVLRDSTSAEFGYILVPRSGTYSSIADYVSAQLEQNAVQ